MKADCVFCRIVKGDIPCEKIYEDEFILAFLDISPVHHGHTLIIPKKHFENMLDMDDEILKRIIVAAKKISLAVEKATEAHGFNFSMNNRPAAGQAVMHAHFHIIPRFEKDGLLPWVRHEKENKIQEFGEKIRKLL